MFFFVFFRYFSYDGLGYLFSALCPIKENNVEGALLSWQISFTPFTHFRPKEPKETSLAPIRMPRALKKDKNILHSKKNTVPGGLVLS